jgi:hypothetical protein
VSLAGCFWLLDVVVVGKKCLWAMYVRW